MVTSKKKLRIKVAGRVRSVELATEVIALLSPEARAEPGPARERKQRRCERTDQPVNQIAVLPEPDPSEHDRDEQRHQNPERQRRDGQ